MTIRPVEWELLHPLDGHPVAVVRLVLLGGSREPYYRAVTPEPNRAERRLIGYWGTVDHAHDGVLALYERASGRSTAGGDRAPARPLVPQKPPPCADSSAAPRHGYASRPARHPARA